LERAPLPSGMVAKSRSSVTCSVAPCSSAATPRDAVCPTTRSNVQAFGLRVSRSGVQGFGFKGASFRVLSSGFGARGFGVRISGDLSAFGFRLSTFGLGGFGFRVWGSGFRGSGFRVTWAPPLKGVPTESTSVPSKVRPVRLHSTLASDTSRTPLHAILPPARAPRPGSRPGFVRGTPHITSRVST